MPEEQVLEVEGEVQTIEEQLEAGEGVVTELSVDVRVVSMADIFDNLDKLSDQLVTQVKNEIEKIDIEKIQSAKKVVSYANKTMQDLSSRRIAIKKEVLKPYDLMADRIDAINKRIISTIEPLKGKIKEVEDAWDKKRADDIYDIKAERFGKELSEIEAFIRKLNWFDDPKWLNKSVTLTKVMNDIDAKVVAIVNDIAALDILNNGNQFATVVAMNYEKNGSLAQAITLRKQLEEEEAARLKRMEAQRLADEARKAQEAELLAKQEKERQEREVIRAAEKAKADAQKPIVLGTTTVPSFMTAKVPDETPQDPEEFTLESDPPEVVEVAQIITFKAELTPSAAVKLITFLKSEGIRYGIIKENN